MQQRQVYRAAWGEGLRKEAFGALGERETTGAPRS